MTQFLRTRHHIRYFASYIREHATLFYRVNTWVAIHVNIDIRDARRTSQMRRNEDFYKILRDIIRLLIKLIEKVYAHLAYNSTRYIDWKKIDRIP